MMPESWKCENVPTAVRHFAIYYSAMRLNVGEFLRPEESPRGPFEGDFRSGVLRLPNTHVPPALGSRLATRAPRRCLSLEKSGLAHRRRNPENPRVGGSIPPLGTNNAAKSRTSNE